MRRNGVLPLCCLAAVTLAAWAGGAARAADPQTRKVETRPAQTHPAQTRSAQTHPSQTRPGSSGVDHSFADVERWVGIFDDPARSTWQMPDQVVAALHLEPGSVVADIGAGTGYFLAHLAHAVSPGGRVLAIDLEPEMVAYMRQRAEEAGLPGVETVLASPDDPHIPAGAADCVLLVDTYHHIHERVAYLERLRAALAPGGQVAVVDFYKRPSPVGPPVEHKMSRDQVLAEFRQAGYELAHEETFLPYQYFLRFRVAAD